MVVEWWIVAFQRSETEQKVRFWKGNLQRSGLEVVLKFLTPTLDTSLRIDFSAFNLQCGFIRIAPQSSGNKCRFLGWALYHLHDNRIYVNFRLKKAYPSTSPTPHPTPYPLVVTWE